MGIFLCTVEESKKSNLILASYLSSPIRCIVIMATDKKDWQEVDPRVEWAMKIFDWGDDEPNGIVQASFIPFSGAAAAGAAMVGATTSWRVLFGPGRPTQS